MANIKSVEDSYFDGFADELNGKFQRLSHLVKHNSSSGNYHEEILRVVLRNFLTKRYSVKTGFIFKGPQEVSNQMDIIIVDENAPAAYVFQEGDFAVVMPEAVVAFIEVKTTLSVQKYDQALQNIASAKKLFEYPLAHPGIVFGYQSDLNAQIKMSDDKSATWLVRQSAKDVPTTERSFCGPDAIIWFNDNYSLLRFNPANKTILDGLTYFGCRNPHGKTGWQLSVMLAILVGACENAESGRTRTFGKHLAQRLLGLNLMEVSDYGFELGKGKIPQKK